VQSMASFDNAGEFGGAMSGSLISGYASFATGNLPVAARADNILAVDDDTMDANKANGMYRAGPNAFGTHGLYFSVAGWSFEYATIQYWPGYFSAPPVEPSGEVTVPANTEITDVNGNSLEPSGGYPKALVTVLQAGSGWDVVPPEVRADLVPGYFDVLPLAAGSDIDSFELRFTENMRDSSFHYRDGATSGIAIGLMGWTFRDADAGDPYRYGATGFETQVNSSAFSSTNISDDNLISMRPVVVNPFWTARSQMVFRYAGATGLVTDAAGNLLLAYTDAACAEKQPPRIRFTSAEIGGSRVYLQFTEPVWHDLGATLSDLFPVTDFVLSGTAVSITSTDSFVTGTAVSEIWLNLSGPLSTADVLNGRISLATTVLDRAENLAEASVIKRAVDIAVGAVSVPGASDGIHVGDETTTESALAAGALGLLRNFDGAGRLYDMDTTIFTTLDLSGISGTAPSLSMYYDVAPDETVLSSISITGRSETLGGFWLPSYLSGFNFQGNEEARTITPFASSGLARNFLVPASDSEIVTGIEVGFMFRLADLWVARDTSADDDPRQFDLWRYKVQDIIKQRGGVTILNNVIDSTRHERTAVQLDLASGGQVTVLVFTLDGDVVRSLHRGRLAAGTYTMTWDGTNAGSNPVARGIYFIRVVGPGIDEIRKVMVVKN